MFQRIFVPVDASETSRHGVAEAIAVARMSGGRIRLMHVFKEPLPAIGAEAALYCVDELLAKEREKGERLLAERAESVRAAGIDVDGVLCEASAAPLCDQVASAATSWGASLIVMGTHGRSGARRLFQGSDAEEILRKAPVPVLLLRSDTPVSVA